MAINTFMNRSKYYEADIAPRFGHLRLKDISAEDVDGYLAEVAKDAQTRLERTGRRNEHYIIERHRALSAILTAAVLWRRIPLNPARGLIIPAYPPPPGDNDGEEYRSEPEKVLAEDQLDLLLKSARTHSRKPLRNEILCLLGSELGLRNSEVRALRPSHFNLGERSVKITSQIIDTPSRLRAPGDKRWKESRTKGKRDRVLPLSRHLSELLRAYTEEHAAKGNPANGFLFPGEETGAPLAIATPNGVVTQLQIHAELTDSAGKPLVTYHGLRHTFASIAICNGVPLFKISRALGHASVAVTERVYAHLLSSSELDEIAEIFNREPWGRAENRAGDAEPA